MTKIDSLTSRIYELELQVATLEAQTQDYTASITAFFVGLAFCMIAYALAIKD